MRRVLFEVKYDETHGEDFSDAIDIFGALYERYPNSLCSIEHIQSVEGEFKDNNIYETDIKPLMSRGGTECTCCPGMDGHVFGIEANGVSEFVNDALYSAVKKGVRRVRVIVREL